MNLTPLQSNFSSGEISPDMQERTETEGYAASVQKMLNCISTPQGPTYNRNPFTFQRQFDGFTQGRIGTIQISANAFLSAVFLQNEIRFFTDGGAPLKSGFVTNPRFSQLGVDWTVITDGSNASSVRFERHNCFMQPNSIPASFAGVKQNVTLLSGTDEHVIFVESNVETLPDELFIKIGSAEGLDDILSAFMLTNSDFIPFVPNTTDIWIEVVNESDVGGDNRIDVHMIDVFDDSAIPTIVTPYLAQDLAQLQFIEAPSADLMYITHHLYPPAFIQYNDVLGVASYGEVTFTSEPSEWGAGNFPRTGVIHKNRMWYANTILEPEQFWASVLGDFEDFTYGTTETGAFSVVNEHFGGIEWMISTKQLIFGASTGEYLISADGPVIFIGDIAIDRQSTYGSVGIRAHQIGDKIVYVSRNFNRLYAMQFNRDNQNWLSDEVSYPANTLMEPAVKELAWEKDPVSIFWMVKLDGTIVGVSYNRPMSIVGWHNHDTQGLFRSVATGDKLGRTDVLVLVDRGDGNLKLEISSTQGAPMDSRITRVYDPPRLVIDGLDPLNGFDCQVIIDNAIHPNRTVVNGEITLQYPSAVTQVGLGYKKQVTTLPFDKGSDRGSARAYVKRYKDIYLKVLSAHIPMINGTISPIRHPATLMNTPEPARTELVKIINLGNDRDALVDIVQEQALSLAIAGIYGEVVQNKL